MNKDVIGIIVGYLDSDSTSNWFTVYKLDGNSYLALVVLQCALDKIHQCHKILKINLTKIGEDLDNLNTMRDELNA